jgi:glycosyltransferase involved in cell wall biosynthesis
MPDISRDTLCRDREKGVAALPDRVCFGLLGRLTREKGAEDVLKFIESCDVPCEFHVAGVGPYADRFATLAAEGKVRPAVVKFYGTYEPTMRAAFFAQFFSKIDWLVIPSIDEWETLSMVTLEAIQHGVPVLCSQAGGLRSFGMPELGPAPRGVIDLFDPVELGDQLREKVALGKTQLMAIDRCREHYKQFFADSIVAQRWYQLVVEYSGPGKSDSRTVFSKKFGKPK